MVGELIMLPVRIGVRATQLWLRAAEETVNVATSAAGRLIGMRSPQPYPHPSGFERNGGTGTAVPGRRPAASSEIEAPSPPARRPIDQTPAPPVQPSRLDAPTASEPAHVSEEPALVEEFAEPGAAEGAGAEIHVEEPWDDYREMNAKQIVARLSSATAAELAAVQLYESTHRKRRTVLNTVERELRNANGRGSATQ